MRRRPASRLGVARLAAVACAQLACAGGSRPAPAPAPASSGTPTIAGRTAGLVRHAGFLPVYVDAAKGKALVELPGDSTRVLLFLTQATGLGSNPVGVDRGADGASYVARFDRAGDRVLLVYENWNYRSVSGDSAHLRTVRESFPPSTVAALPLVAAEGSRLLVDMTGFLTSDQLDVSRTLQQTGQGSYAVAADRSSIDAAATQAFPDNTELDARLTFAAAGRPGAIVERIVPDGRAFTLRQHVSLLRLPDAGYRPRVLDPRVGFFGITFRDYSQPVEGSLEQHLIARHRLERVNPADPNSPIKDPIVYYIDRGIPEPIRSASVAGAKFWEQAFDRAGLKGGFVVKDLPEGVDPMDARYNVVQWVNRNERGWSIGGSLGDPRTGEIIKGMARLDSHRARTSYNLYAGLMGADSTGADTSFVLGRVRQVTSHEIGHTLGLAHNYIASTYERGSVMDYPAPRVRLTKDGRIDVSSAYDVGPGAYDVWAIRWGYGIFPAASEQDSLAALMREGLRQGFLFLSDADARPDFASDPRTNLWDDAATPVEFLEHQTAVRRVALRNFGERNIRPGEPVALLQERFAPVYFFHRFAINSLAKTIGGMEYSNAVRGDQQQATRPVDGRRQRAALSALAAELRPEELAIPDTVLTLLGPRPFGWEGNDVELFRSRTRPAFDEFGAARTLAQMIVDAVLQRERAARLVLFSARPSADGPPLGLPEAIDTLVAATWRRPAPASPKLVQLQRVGQRAVVDRLLALAADKDVAPPVRGIVDYEIAVLRDEARRRAQAGDVGSRAHWGAIAGDLTRWIERQELPTPTPALVAPPGDPFGEDAGW